ncbi:hypothetical protein [Ligilactobacillus sp. 110_WCHN]|uniref:hypothetical protein n=1 Tax=Ligilactobacillus sp. 110_WCHN TaxID=3057125 RepID=UPI002672D2E8|nr:hypothetical protein [Ligilactobacillus sp. 110_WCHN]MDO3393572.1 hypothetical protein [Ligilactobacillus sp. 110_WCHN]
MIAQKKPGKTELAKTMTNNFNKVNYFKKIHQIQVFRKELPLILRRIPLEQRIELLEKMIPKIEVKQMAIFARQLQDAYIAVWYLERKDGRCVR